MQFFRAYVMNKCLKTRSEVVCFIIVFLVWLSSTAFAANTCSQKGCHGGKDNELVVHPDEIVCENCHKQIAEAHPENDTKAFTLKKSNICNDCHDDVSENKFIHTPVKEGACYLCHYPHGKLQQKLLRKDYTTKNFISYREDSYPLCFSCHRRELLRFPDTSFSTDFRDGNRNLHFLHVNKAKRGRNCIICHEVHGGGLPKLMKETAPFGKWRLPLNFKKTATGGRCSPGCHKKYTYNREKGN